MRELLVNGNGQPEDKATPLVVIVIIWQDNNSSSNVLQFFIQITKLIVIKNYSNFRRFL